MEEILRNSYQDFEFNFEKILGNFVQIFQIISREISDKFKRNKVLRIKFFFSFIGFRLFKMSKNKSEIMGYTIVNTDESTEKSTNFC